MPEETGPGFAHILLKKSPQYSVLMDYSRTDKIFRFPLISTSQVFLHPFIPPSGKVPLHEKQLNTGNLKYNAM